MLNRHNKNLINYILLVILFTIPICVVNASESKDATIESINIQANKNIEISWGSLYFTYDMTSSYIWDENTHKYKENVSGVWKDNGKVISVTNKSLLPVDVDFEYTKSTQEVDATFSSNHLYLKKDQKESVKLYLKGEPKNKTNNFYKIGVVTAIVT